ncbi:MAG: membrane protein insertion efficiency factor YidD [Thermodesulfobacteriota bacterium]|nr:membrane protein insertion efficiency factor YidD [Thermodesulfobacteriota bacterium]
MRSNLKNALHLQALFLAALGLLISCAHPSESPKGDNDVSPAAFLIKFYQGPLNHLSSVKQSGCPMYPSCSEYSIRCVQKHGFFMGWIMTCDRLMRCGRDEMALSSRIFVNGEWKHYDPLEMNDFWWSSE